MQLLVSHFSDYCGSPQYVVAAAVTGVLVLIFVYKKLMLNGPKLPPGPLAWPVIGNLPLVGSKPHHSFMNMSKKYGPIMYLQLGSVPTIIIQSPEMAKEVLRTQDQILSSRPDTLTGEVFFYNSQDLLFAPLGPTFKLLRRTCINSLFTPKRLAQSQGVRKEMLTAFLQKILQESSGGKPIHMDLPISEMNFNTVSKILYGKSYYGLKMKNVEGSVHTRMFHEIADEWTRVAGGVIIGDYLPYLRKLDIGGAEAHLRRLREEFNSFLTGIIEEHKQKALGADVGSGKGDFVDVLLSLPADEDGNRLTEIQIKAFLQDLTLGGIDTSAQQTLWTLVELVRHPEVIQKVQAELDAVVGKERMVEDSDLARLPYFRAVVKEAFRLHPAAPFLAPHQSIKATKIAGYDVPQRTRFLVNVYAIHRSPDAWPEPEKFNPDRFFGAQQSGKTDDYKFLPFGSGRRMCPGMDYGIVLVELTLAALLHTCDLSLPQGMKPMDVSVEESFGITLNTATPLEIVLTPRLPLTVYKEFGIEL